MTAPSPRDRGFTLIETIVALVVFALGVLVIGALMPLGNKKVSNSAESAHASELAATTAEKLLATPYSHSDLSSGNHDDPANPHSGRYYVSWTIEDDQPIADCKRITVEVRWPLPVSPRATRLVVVAPRSGG